LAAKENAMILPPTSIVFPMRMTANQSNQSIKRLK
jgi:hypothetical protein